MCLNCYLFIKVAIPPEIKFIIYKSCRRLEQFFIYATMFSGSTVCVSVIGYAPSKKFALDSIRHRSTCGTTRTTNIFQGGTHPTNHPLPCITPKISALRDEFLPSQGTTARQKCNAMQCKIRFMWQGGQCSASLHGW